MCVYIYIYTHTRILLIHIHIHICLVICRWLLNNLELKHQSQTLSRSNSRTETEKRARPPYSQDYVAGNWTMEGFERQAAGPKGAETLLGQFHLHTLNYGNHGLFLTVGSAGLISNSSQDGVFSHGPYRLRVTSALSDSGPMSRRSCCSKSCLVFQGFRV